MRYAGCNERLDSSDNNERFSSEAFKKSRLEEKVMLIKVMQTSEGIIDLLYGFDGPL